MKASKSAGVKRSVKSTAATPKNARLKADAAKSASARSKSGGPQPYLANDSAKRFIQSSLGAFSKSRDDATEAVAEGIGRFAETIGLRKLEDVFDQRVAGALERIGIPSVLELAQLREQVDVLSREVAVLTSRLKK